MMLSCFFCESLTMWLHFSPNEKFFLTILIFLDSWHIMIIWTITSMQWFHLGRYRQSRTSHQPHQTLRRPCGPRHESQRATSGPQAVVWEPLVYAYKIYPKAITVLAVLCYQKYYTCTQPTHITYTGTLCVFALFALQEPVPVVHRL